MAIQDFLVTFRADTTQATAAINALYARVQQVDSQLNRAMGRAGSVGAGAQFTQMARGAQAATAATGKLYDKLADFNPVYRKNAQGVLVADKAVARLAQRYIDLSKNIRDAQAAGVPVSPAQYDKAIVALEALRGKAGVTNDTINGLQQSLRDQSGIEQQAKGITQLNRRFRELDAQMGRAGGMNARNIREQRQVIAELNKLGGVQAGADPRISRMGPIIEDQFRRLPSAIQAAAQSMHQWNTSVREQIELANRFQTPLPSARTVANAFQNSLNVLRTPGLDPDTYREAAAQGRIFADTLNRFPPGLNETARAFGTHARRIAEGILLYDAFGRAIQAVSNQIKLVGDLAREQIRFEAVVGDLGEGGDTRFLQGIGDVAERTNTNLADLASIMDTVAFATDRSTSATQRQAEALEIMGRVGEFTNVTQRDLQTETENLVGIMNVFGLTLEQWEDALGGITVMGGGSSRAIQAITDVLSVAGRSARAAGIDLEFLGGLGVEVFRELQGSMSGSEIGSQLNTIFGKLADPTIQRNIEELTGGLIQFRDATGQLRSGSEVFTEIFAAIDAGAVSSQTASEILDQIVPPLNPGARSFVEVLKRVLPDALETAGEGARATGDDLTKLSDKLVSGPAERFSRAIIALQTAFTEFLRSDIAGGMTLIANIFSGLASVLESDIGGNIANLTLKIAAFFLAVRAGGVALKGLSILLFGNAKRMAELYKAAQEAGVETEIFGDRMGRVGRAADAGVGKMKTLLTTIKNVGRALAVPFTLFIAIEVLGSIPELVGNLTTDIETAFANARIDTSVLERARAALDVPIVGGLAEFAERTMAGIGSGEEISPQQFKNIMALVEATIQLKQENKLTADSYRILERAVLRANGGAEVTDVTVQGLIDTYNESVNSTDKASDSTSEYDRYLREASEGAEQLTASQMRLATSLEIGASLTDARAAEMQRLNEALSSGAINLDEYSEAQGNLGRASEAASDWLAAYGDQLSLLPGLQEEIARTGKPAAEALLSLLLANPDTIDERIDILDQMVALAEARDELQENLTENPITFSVETQKLIDDVTEVQTILEPVMNGWLVVERTIAENPLEPEIALERLRAQAVAALQIYQTLLAAQAAYHRATSSAQQAANPEVGTAARAMARNAGAEVDALNSAIAELENAAATLAGAGGELGAAGELWNTLGGISGDDPRLGGGTEPSQTGIIDIGDLPASAIATIISMAQQAQSRVVAAGGTVDADETVAFFKDAAFQQLLSGVDQRFLQQAIEELTDVERRRLELEQQRLQDVTRSMLVQTGPIQSIVSAPVLAAGGGVLSGQGLNADPRLGNFTINVPINWSGMSLTQLQKFIYDSIAQAWIDAGRGG